MSHPQPEPDSGLLLAYRATLVLGLFAVVSIGHAFGEAVLVGASRQTLFASLGPAAAIGVVAPTLCWKFEARPVGGRLLALVYVATFVGLCLTDVHCPIWARAWSGDFASWLYLEHVIHPPTWHRLATSLCVAGATVVVLVMARSPGRSAWLWHAVLVAAPSAVHFALFLERLPLRHKFAPLLALRPFSDLLVVWVASSVVGAALAVTWVGERRFVQTSRGLCRTSCEFFGTTRQAGALCATGMARRARSRRTRVVAALVAWTLSCHPRSRAPSCVRLPTPSRGDLTVAGGIRAGRGSIASAWVRLRVSV